MSVHISTFKKTTKPYPYLLHILKQHMNISGYRGLFGGWLEIWATGVPKTWGCCKSKVSYQATNTTVSLGLLPQVSLLCPIYAEIVSTILN